MKTWIKEFPQDWLPGDALHQNLSAYIDGIKKDKDAELEKVMAGIKIVLSKTSTITVSNSSGGPGSPAPATGPVSMRSAPLTQLRIANQLKST